MKDRFGGDVMTQMVGVINERLSINGEFVEWPNRSSNKCISQYGNKVYVDGFEWTGTEWKRTLLAMWHYLLCFL